MPPSGVIITASAICLLVSIGVPRDYIQVGERRAIPQASAPTGSALVTWADADPVTLMEILFWNRGISRVLVIGGGTASDGYPSIDAELGRGGAFVGSGQLRPAGPYVFGPDMLVVASGVPVPQQSTVVTLTRAPSVVVTNWYRRTGYVGLGGSIDAVADRRPMRIVIRLRAVDGTPKTVQFNCRHGYNERVRLGSKPARVTIPVLRHEVQECRFAASGSLRFKNGLPIVMKGRLTFEDSAR